jgi:uncharacterized PurR-regulated membrane protein YhhQ (DUF165 family)
MVDSVAVILITFFYAGAIYITPGETVTHGIVILILSNYFYKMVSALIDTGPFYIGVKYLSRYLHLDPNKDYKDSPSES